MTPKFYGDFLVERYIYDHNFFIKKSDQFSRDMSQIVEKMLDLAMLKNLQKSLDPDPEADNFQKFNQLLLVHRYICGKSFVKIRSVPFTRNC